MKSHDVSQLWLVTEFIIQEISEKLFCMSSGIIFYLWMFSLGYYDIPSILIPHEGYKCFTSQINNFDILIIIVFVLC